MVRERDRGAEPGDDSLVTIYKRGRLWWAAFHDDGRHVRRSLGTPYISDARMIATKIEKRLRGKDVGIDDKFAEHAARPIAEHVEGFKVTLEAKGRTPEHVALTVKHVREGIAAMGAKRIGDLGLEGASRWLEDGAALGLSARTLNARAQSLRAFGRWIRLTRRAPDDPVLGLPRRKVNAEDRRRVRRALTPDEAGRLLDVARRKPVEEVEKRGHRLTDEGRALLAARGEARALVYLFAMRVGLRRSELTALRWRDLDLDAREATIAAGSAKARRLQRAPLALDVAEALTAAKGKREAKPDDLVFPSVPAVRTLHRDLRYAGVEPVNADGEVLDFHALRVTCGTRLSDAGVPLVQAQRIMRHSTPTLTANIYTKPASADLLAAVTARLYEICTRRASPRGPGRPRMARRRSPTVSLRTWRMSARTTR